LIVLAAVAVVVLGAVAVRRRGHRPAGRHCGGRRWLLSCDDAAGRPARLGITVTATDRFVIHTPGGEAVTLSPRQVGQLRHVLRDALMTELPLRIRPPSSP
jgi:hypothetical protein